ncbi:MAG: hypothetical protein JJ992_24275, partial [Planctomycetes bacterium]|nr:hypothetical protein [Planctomycetota bacterium]
AGRLRGSSQPYVAGLLLMTHSFDIGFDPRSDREKRTWRLDLVISPIDDFTGRVITGGVIAEIPLQGARARRSLSGHLVFERLFPADKHLVDIDPEAAGYFAPDPVAVQMPQDDREMRVVRLIRRPDAVEDGASMVVRGSVVRQGSGSPVEGQLVQGKIAGIAEPFRTLTNERGNFALRLRPPAPFLGADPVRVPMVADVTLAFVEAGIPEMMLAEVEDMHTRVLPAQVEIP